MLISLLPRLIQRANAAVHDCTPQPEYRGKNMATTLVACALRYDQAIVSHVGDSRCYLVRNGKRGRSRRTTPCQRAAQDGPHLRQRNCRLRCPSRAHSLPWPEMFVSPDTTAVALQPGDVLVLSTDGLHDEMRDPEIAAIVSQKKDAR